MIEGDAEGIAFRVRPPADARRPFDNDDRLALGNEPTGGRESGGAGADDDDIWIGREGLRPCGQGRAREQAGKDRSARQVITADQTNDSLPYAASLAGSS